MAKVKLDLLPDTLSWRSEERQLRSLIPLEKNPFGKINARAKKRLEDKLKTLGVFEVATIDTDGILLTWNKRHAILMELGRGEELFPVMVPNRPLTPEERKQIILSSNIHEGNWIEEILKEEYGDLDLSGLGLELQFNDLLAEEVNKVKSADEPVYPIVAEFSEKHDAIIIISNNEIDTNYLKQILGLEKMLSYKSEAVGQSLVINAKDFISAWNSKSL